MTHRFLAAIRREPVDCTPVWFMRQAGRYQQKYRDLRKKHSILELCDIPELAAQVSMFPVEMFPAIDAAIVFSDLLVIPRAMGIDVEFQAGEGPVIRNPVRTKADVDALRPLDPSSLPVLKALRIVKRELGGKRPLIGFAGAPFTLASYLVEGGPSRHFIKTKSMMYSEPRLWKLLVEKLAAASTASLQAQVAAGADVVQVFDSWVGALSPEDYRTVKEATASIFAGLRGLAPTIHFGTDTATLLEPMMEAGGDAIGVDWRIPLDAAWNRVAPRAIQGNLDPVALLAPREDLLRQVDIILEKADNRPGHIFNLGHGILPETDPEAVAAVIERVHTKTRRA